MDNAIDNDNSCENRVIPGRNGGTLRPFPKGNHMGGHPKGVKNFMSKVNKYGKWKTPESFLSAIKKAYPDKQKELDNLKNEDGAALKFWMAVLAGEPWAIKELFDRKDGKAKESIDLTTGGKEIKQLPSISVVNQECADLLKKALNGGFEIERSNDIGVLSEP